MFSVPMKSKRGPLRKESVEEGGWEGEGRKLTVKGEDRKERELKARATSWLYGEVVVLLLLVFKLLLCC